MGGDLYALDFDGVLCDSCGESSLSAIKAAKVRWPWVFEQVDAAMEEWIVEQMYTLRPVVETGYENLLLVRLLVEIRIPSARKSLVADGLSIQEILETWLKLKPRIMSDWDEDRDSLVDLFGSIRDDWIKNDLSGWIGANRFYPGTADALKFSSSEVYIVTTKQGRFAEALLKELAGIELPSERIYGLGTGPKVKVLQQLQQMPQHQGLKLHFVEDRLATLQNVIKEPALDQWNLYLVNWGYNTPKEREEAEAPAAGGEGMARSGRMRRGCGQIQPQEGAHGQFLATRGERGQFLAAGGSMATRSMQEAAAAAAWRRR
ncbi:hypothetical protein GUJ93_ZPchr0007g6132 [Zizania palustris]|uniref:Uncharacterized protein n=1 Tax=Zizania palustris TaxID=103762 RepID=A0A8J5SRS9_ZIZPA|nr:hypothetical protein GUJ93_ZPchr0007g6132 [Zizania palustris]